MVDVDGVVERGWRRNAKSATRGRMSGGGCDGEGADGEDSGEGKATLLLWSVCARQEPRRPVPRHGSSDGASAAHRHLASPRN